MCGHKGGGGMTKQLIEMREVPCYSFLLLMLFCVHNTKRKSERERRERDNV